jgi:hypothetical protein
MKNIAAAIIAFVGPVQGASIPAVRNVEAHSSLAPRADCSNITCTPASGAAHIVVSRASTEAPGTGVLGSVAEAIVASRPGSDIATNPYPALLDPYLESETAGVGNLTEIVLEYQTCCPDSKMVLLGYSQVRNAQIITQDRLARRNTADLFEITARGRRAPTDLSSHCRARKLRRISSAVAARQDFHQRLLTPRS